MPFQAVAWAWRLPVEKPEERLAILWLANVAGEGGGASFSLSDLAAFACVPEDECLAILDRLEERDYVYRDPNESYWVYVALPLLDGWPTPPNRALVPRELRGEVLRDAGGHCFACRAEGDLQVDHIIPRAKGGSNDRENLQALCGGCNSHKRDKLGWVA